MTDDKRSEGQWRGKGWIPTNKEYYKEGTPFGPAVGPSERRRRRAEGKKIEKAMDSERERGIENWPPN